MSPTPDQIGRRIIEGLSSGSRETGEQERRLKELDAAISEVTEVCKNVVGGESHKSDCELAGYLLDFREETPSLHPVIKEVLAGGGAVQDRYFLMEGRNFNTSVENKFGGKQTGTMSVKLLRNWEEPYVVCRGFLKYGGRLVLVKESEVYSPRGLIFLGEAGCLQPGVHISNDIAEAIAVKEEIVLALANAAGINPESEGSEDFPLLSEQLHKITRSFFHRTHSYGSH